MLEIVNPIDGVDDLLFVYDTREMLFGSRILDVAKLERLLACEAIEELDGRDPVLAPIDRLGLQEPGFDHAFVDLTGLGDCAIEVLEKESYLGHVVFDRGL